MLRMGAVLLIALLAAALCASSATAIEWRKPLVGNPAPDFKAQAVFNEEFKEIRLSDYIGKKCGSPCMPTAIILGTIQITNTHTCHTCAHPETCFSLPADVVLFFYPLGKGTTAIHRFEKQAWP